MRLLYIRKHGIAIANQHHYDTHAVKFNRDRKKPHGTSLPHHRTYGSRIRRFLETSLISCCPGPCQFGQPHLTKQFCRQRQIQRWRFAQAPWPMRAFACVPSLAHTDPAFP